MKRTTEITNGIIIFIGIGVYFLILEYLGLADQFLLRTFNLLIVAFGVNRAIKTNYKNGLRGYNNHLFSAFITSMIGAFLCIASLLAYIEYRGGEAYIQRLSKGFLFGGGDLTVNYYCIGLLFESIASSIIISFCLMQFWKNKVETINKLG